MCYSSFFAIIWQKIKKNTSWKFTDESSITFQSSVRGPGEFGLYLKANEAFKMSAMSFQNKIALQ